MSAFQKLADYFTAHPDVSQSDFASRVGAWQSQVCGWLNKRGVPGIQHMRKVNRLIGTTTEEWIEAKASLPGRRGRAA